MTITEEQKRAIDNYGARISTLKDFVAACRKRPGMHIGPLGGPGMLNMIREIFQNAVDQMMEPESPCDWFSLQYDERTLEVIVEDNGMGFPFDDILRIFTKEYTSKNYEKVPGHYSSGLHGVGAKVVNALSSYMSAESYRYDGKAIKIEFQKGYPIGKPYEIKNPTKKQGARVTFVPDLDIMGDIDLPWTEVYDLIKHIMSITFIGAHMDFIGIDKNGKVHKESIINTDGIITDLIMKVGKPLVKPIVVHADDGWHKLDAAFTIDSEYPDLKMTSFSNFCPTKEGTHINGTLDGICRWFVNYMNKIYLINQKSKNKISVIANDIKVGLSVMISAAHLEPNFTGQAKEILSNTDMIEFCKNTVMSGLDEWSKGNPGDLAKLCQYFKDIAEVRLKQDNDRVKIVAKYQKNILTDYPLKYARPSERCDELFFVEGDSAGGIAKTARDVKTQGIYPLRGKIPSAFEKSKQEFFDNAEIQGMAKIILNKEYTRNFDPIKDVQWKKIIFMADADVDGSHIASLLLRYFILYMPQLIQAGKVYKAIPPLYGWKNGKKITYFTNQMDFVRFVQKLFIETNKLSVLGNKNTMSGKDITLLFMNNEDYVFYVETLSNTYGVDPMVLELGLLSYVNSYTLAETKKKLKDISRFMGVEKSGNNVIFDGTVRESNFMVLGDRLIRDCKPLINIMKKNTSFYFDLNGKPVSLYQVMKAFDSSTPKGIQRYKGLGEMDSQQLAESTMLPTSDRTLIQYTLENMKEEFEAIKAYESDRSKLLDFIGNVKRTDLLD